MLLKTIMCRALNLVSHPSLHWNSSHPIALARSSAFSFRMGPEMAHTFSRAWESLCTPGLNAARSETNRLTWEKAGRHCTGRRKGLVRSECDTMTLYPEAL